VQFCYAAAINFLRLTPLRFNGGPSMAKQQEATDLQRALKACKGSFVSVGFFSMFVNLLMLVPPLYMLQVYDRVLSTQSVDTLLMLTLVVVFLFMIMGGLELVRSRILVRVGNKLVSP
jgi:ATP-binding cassette, subfamily C, bacterial EexD